MPQPVDDADEAVAIADEPQLPLGGVRDSGWGRSGPESMGDFTEVQWITTRDGTGHYPI
jgi:acyl-CoA reductase-like NAD-dependent aldehyde dehydrogenase